MANSDLLDPNSGAAFFGEDSWRRGCNCGLAQDNFFHCDRCGAPPPWGCGCDACNPAYAPLFRELLDGATLPPADLDSSEYYHPFGL